jgi:hypothetical protein
MRRQRTSIGTHATYASKALPDQAEVYCLEKRSTAADSECLKMLVVTAAGVAFRSNRRNGACPVPGIYGLLCNPG